METQRGFDALVSSGQVIDVTHIAGKSFPAGRVAIEASVYEQHVAWPNQAMRNHLMHEDEASRLSLLLQSAAVARRHETPAEFTHRGLACDAESSIHIRHALVLERFDDTVRTGWLIR